FLARAVARRRRTVLVHHQRGERHRHAGLRAGADRRGALGHRSFPAHAAARRPHLDPGRAHVLTRQSPGHRAPYRPGPGRTRRRRKDDRGLRAQTRRKVAALAAVTWVMVLGNTMLFPVFPAIRAELELSGGQLAWLVAAISLPSAGLSPLAGALSDRIGRKAVIVPSLVLYGAGGLLAALAGWRAEAPFAWMVAGRLLQGLGSSGPMQLTMALA